MTPRATGRSRHVEVTIVGSISYNAGTFDTGSGTWSPEAFATVFGSGWLTGAGLTGGESAHSTDGKTIEFSWGAGWGLLLDTIVGTQLYNLASDGSQGAFPTVTAISGTATGTASYDLIEWEAGGAPYELSGPVTRALDASLTITFSTVHPTLVSPGPIPPAGTVLAYGILFTDSVSFSGSVSGTMIPGQVPDYRLFHRLFAINADAVGNISVSCDGIGYSQSISAPTIDSGCTLSGSVLAPTLHVPSGGGVLPGPNETVTIDAEPDWALQATLQARYYGGDPFPGAEVELRLNADGTGVLDSQATDGSGVAVLTYPNGGYYGAGFLGWYHVFGFGTEINNGQQLSANRASVYVNEAWADSYGADGGRMHGLFGPNEFSRVVGLYALPRFTAGSLAIASSHAFGIFASVAPWSALFGTLTLDAGVWKWATDGSANFGLANGPNTFLPLAYRYYTLRLKSDTPGLSLKLTATLFRVTDPHFGTLHARASWIIVPSTTDYQDYELDWLFPDLLEDDVLATSPSPISQRYPFHSYFCQPHYQATGEAIQLSWIFPPGVTVHVESLTGHQRSDGSRTAMTLHAPLPDWLGGQPETAMKPFVGAGPQDTWGWLQPNAAVGAYLQPQAGFVAYPVAGTVQDAVTNLQDLYDTAARDTGLTITDAADPMAARNSWGPETWLVADGVTLPRGPADAASTDIVGTRRLGDTYGYYGMGDCVGSAYGANLIYAGDFWLDGELTALAWRPRGSVAGVSLSLIDNDTGAVLDTAVTDDDGLWAVSAKYGIREPFSSAPANDQTLPAHQQFTDHGFAPPDYTAAGKLLNSYWLTGPGKFRTRPGNVLEYSPQQQFQKNYAPYPLDVEVFTGQPHHYDLPVGSPSRNPDNLTDPLGRFWRASLDDLGAGDTLMVRRMDFNTPAGGGWAVETDLGPDATEPCLAIQGQDLALRGAVTYTRSDGVWLRETDDDGETWEPEAFVIPNGTLSRQFPKVPSPTGERFIVALVPGSPNLLQAIYRGPADAAWSDVFSLADQDGNPLAVETDGFDLAWGLEPATGFVRNVLSVVIAGETEVSEWVNDSEPDFDSPAWLFERVV